MKKLLLLSTGILLSASVAFSQVPRLSLHEEFTGENCPPCATSDPGFDAVLASPANQPKIISIKWFVPIVSAPTPTWSLYRSNKTEINWRYLPSPSGYGYTTQNTSTTTATNGVVAAPMSQLDGQDQWVFGAAGNHVNYVNDAVVDSAHAFDSPFSVTMAKSWDQNMTVMTVTVNIVAVQDFSATGSLIFRAVMIEKTVTFSVAPGFSGQTVFNNPVIASFPSIQAGTPLSQAWTTGQSQTFVLSCPVPNYRRDINQVDMVGFIQDDGNQKIAQAVRASDCIPSPISVSGPQGMVCAGQSVTLTAAGSSFYLWSNGTIGSSIVVSASDADYWVMNTNEVACSDIAAIALRTGICSGLQNINANTGGIHIYPNPSRGEFTIKMDSENQTALLIIYDLLGKKVLEQTLYGQTFIKADLAKGLYRYSVTSEDKPLQAGKLVIE